MRKEPQGLFARAEESLLSSGRAAALNVDMFAINKHQFGEGQGRLSALTTRPAVKG